MCFLSASQFPNSSNIEVLGAKTNPPEPETFIWNYTQNIKSQDRKKNKINKSIRPQYFVSPRMCVLNEILRCSQRLKVILIILWFLGLLLPLQVVANATFSSLGEVTLWNQDNGSQI